MRYSLLSRFQGTLLAAALGDELGAYGWLGHCLTPQSNRVLTPEALPPTTANLAAWYPGIGTNSSLDFRYTALWGKVATSCARLLVQLGRWHELEMAAIGAHLATARMPTAASEPTPVRPLIAAEYALAMLPIALFCYENESKQQQLLVQTAQLWRCPPGTEEGVVAIGYALAQVLNERLDRRTLVPQTITYLKRGTANPTAPLLDLVGSLEQVQILLQQGAGLYTAIEQLRAGATYLGNRAIALAFYCFLGTPDNPELSLLRAARSGDTAPAVCALTGALSGAHNSLNALPLTWRSQPAALLWGLSDQEMNQLAADLLTVWAGGNPLAGATKALAIAAPGVIRPR